MLPHWPMLLYMRKQNRMSASFTFNDAFLKPFLYPAGCCTEWLACGEVCGLSSNCTCQLGKRLLYQLAIPSGLVQSAACAAEGVAPQIGARSSGASARL